MQLGVTCKVGLLRERFAAMPALEGFDTGVDPRMTVQIRLSRESFGAKGALERTLSSVNSNTGETKFCILHKEKVNHFKARFYI